MPYRYLCANHAKLVRRSDEIAQKYWSMFMARGQSAYSDCRWEGAEIYLSAAIDVAAVRLPTKGKNSFNFSHILEPLHILCNIYAADQKVAQAQQAISYVRTLLLAFSEPTFIDSLLRKCTQIALSNQAEPSATDSINTSNAFPFMH